MRLAGQVALVTGAAGGIGGACARRLAAEGARLVLADLRSEELRAAAATMPAESVLAAVPVDVTNPESVRAMVAAALAAGGRLDGLVNVAGGTTHIPRRPDEAPLTESAVTPMADITPAYWHYVLDLNLTSVFLCTQAALPAMQGQGYGRVVSIASMAGKTPMSVSGATYAAAKAGVIGLTKHVAWEVVRHGITVNAVAPGLVLTPRIKEVYLPLPTTQQLIAGIPIGRGAEPEEIASAVAYLAAPEAAYITGVTLDVNGGWLMT